MKRELYLREWVGADGCGMGENEMLTFHCKSQLRYHGILSDGVRLDRDASALHTPHRWRELFILGLMYVHLKLNVDKTVAEEKWTRSWLRLPPKALLSNHTTIHFSRSQ